jgi:FtsP/CotA-like multicopper oxidase with cupredoxin domain
MVCIQSCSQITRVWHDYSDHSSHIDLFPSPTIEARSGDTLLITVTNAVEEESIALHWHGIHVSSMYPISVLTIIL